MMRQKEIKILEEFRKILLEAPDKIEVYLGGSPYILRAHYYESPIFSKIVNIELNFRERNEIDESDIDWDDDRDYRKNKLSDFF